MSLRTPWLVSIALAAGAGLVSAQDVAQPAAPARAVPQYQVEVLIFAHRDFNPNEELFTHEDARVRALAPQPAPGLDVFPFPDPALEIPAVVAPSDATPLGGVAPAPGGATAPGLASPATGSGPATALDPGVAPGDPAAPDAAQAFRFRLLRPDELQLTNAYRALTRLAAYHPLAHGGWVQLGQSDDEALPIDLGVLGVANPSGTIRLTLTRFLHVKLDLTYHGEADPVPVAGSVGLAELPVSPRYHLDVERTVRSGEIHYFDHPAFGVLIKVTPVRPSTGAEAGRPAA